MDHDRFDDLTRRLTATRSRRGALTWLLGGTLGLLGMEAAAKKGKIGGKGKSKKKKPKQETACEAVSKACGQGGCQFGAACCYNENCDSCANSHCIGPASNVEGPLVPGTCGCLSGREFLNGACGERPQCLPAGAKRGFYDIRCCSGIEHPVEGDTFAICDPGYLSCLSNADCVGGLCRGYVCEAQTLDCLAR